MNQEIRQKALDTFTQFKSMFGYENKGVIAILQFYGDVEHQLNDYLIDLERNS